MSVIGVAIEIIIEILRNVRGLGAILGFLTNGPELIVLVVGIMTGDALFGTSTPLGSSVINPVMLVLAMLLSGGAIKLLQTKLTYGLLCIAFTAALSLIFYIVPENFYLGWMVIAFLTTSLFFFLRPKEERRGERSSDVASWAIVPAVILLFLAGSFLDLAVDFAREVSGVPKNLIGFLVLATLSSWPEFKSCLVLLRDNRVKVAGNNILVSNITNIWLAIIGISFYLF